MDQIEELNARIMVLMNQRNAALNDAAVLAARCHLQESVISKQDEALKKSDEALSKAIGELKTYQQPDGEKLS